VGLTAVGDTASDAAQRHRQAERILLDEARLAGQGRPLLS
jgi:hypothetical protein